MAFDQLAPHYHWLERVLAGSVLQEARLAHLAQLDAAENILLVGEGPGRFLGALRTRRPEVPITVIDASAKMLAQARAVGVGPTTFVRSDITRDGLPAAEWDAIVTHCFLDCFAPATLSRVIDQLASAAKPAAHWLITDFALPASGWRRARARLAHALMYRTFRWAAQLEARHWTDPAPHLHRTGFRLARREVFNHGLIHADHWFRS
jgi:SAM-dependent methyltransferase